jgi:hypothetical protein
MFKLRSDRTQGWAPALALLLALSTATGCVTSNGNTASEDEPVSEGDPEPEDNTEPSENTETDEDRAVETSADAGGATIEADAATEQSSDAPQEEDATAPNITGKFVVPSQVYGPDFATSTSYIPIVSSLDVDEISLANAKELDGRASVGAVGEWLFVASSSQPVVTRYTLSESGELTEAGKLNFSNYGVPEYFSLDAWGAVFVNAEKAYIFNGSDGSHVIWNPTTMEVTGEIPGPDVTEEGYNMESIAVVRGDRMYRLFTFLNYDSWEFLSEPQYLAVYDVETDELLDVVEESRCPQLYSRPFVDEQGDIYFSGWVWTPGLTLTSDYPKSCALRVKSGQDVFDPEWQLNFADDVTDGREAGILRYLGNGKALLDVFYDERADIGEQTDPQELSNTPNWRLWMVDLADNSGGPVEGLSFKAGGYQDVQVDGRTFLMVPNEDYSRTTAYEVKGGEAVKGFEIQGSSYHMVEIE